MAFCIERQKVVAKVIAKQFSRKLDGTGVLWFITLYVSHGHCMLVDTSFWELQLSSSVHHAHGWFSFDHDKVKSFLNHEIF